MLNLMIKNDYDDENIAEKVDSALIKIFKQN